MQALKKLVGVAVAAELAVLGGSYYAFLKLNTDSEFRGWVDTNCPAVLDGFCAAVEAVDTSFPRSEAVASSRSCARREKTGGG